VASVVAGWFLLFALPSALLAILALRDFLHRGAPDGARRLRRAQWLIVGAGALVGALGLTTLLLTGGAPLRTPGGWVFLVHAAVMTALGPLGAWLFGRAQEAPLRRTIKAAETVPTLLVLLDLILVVNAAVQGP
jgi:hypothetical protein